MEFITFNILNERHTGWHHIKEGEECTMDQFRRRLENKNSTRRRMNMIMEIIKQYKFDIILLQEVGKELHYQLENLQEEYFMSNLFNDSQQVTMLKKSKFKNMIIHYQLLKRIDTCSGITKDGKEILILNGHLPWGDDRQPYVNYINETVKKFDTFIFAGDTNVSITENLVPSARSLTKDFDHDKYATSYSRGDCVNGKYKYKKEDKRYEFIDHIYVSHNINATDVKVFTSYDKKLSDEVSFKDIRAPYHVSDWPSDHAMLYTKLTLKKSKELDKTHDASYKYIKYKKKYKQLQEIYFLSQ